MSERGLAWWRWVALAAVLAAATGYALRRYVALGTTNPENIPAFVGNKVVAIGATVAMLLAAAAHAAARPVGRAFWLRAAITQATLHLLLSLALLNRAYYPKFFAGDRMKFTGELAIVLGVLAAMVWLVWLRRSGADRPARWVAALGALLLAGHQMAIGLFGWQDPSGWPGGMPPITLLCFALSLPAATLWLVRRN